MATPLRFRHDPAAWSERRVERDLLADLDSNIGATMQPSWYRAPQGYETVRFDMDNGDTALFAWRDGVSGAPGTDTDPPTGGGFWVGNTETPSAMWRTQKYDFAAIPDPVAEWAERELLAELHETAPWLEAYPALSWFFLPVLLSKDGRETTLRYFQDYIGGFPDADTDRARAFYDSFLATGVLDEHRGAMAAKLGTSPNLDRTRMDAAMSEFTVAWLLDRAGYDPSPEAPVTTGHSIDFRIETEGGAALVEVTRPLPPDRRNANTGPAAVRDTAANKAGGQLADHGGGVTLFVDCSGFDESAWRAVREATPTVPHKPAVVFRARPDGSVEAYRLGGGRIDLHATVTPV